MNSATLWLQHSSDSAVAHRDLLQVTMVDRTPPAAVVGENAVAPRDYPQIGTNNQEKPRNSD